MPFIDSKIAGRVTEEKKEAVKQKLGQAVRLLNKSEQYLMVGFEDGQRGLCICQPVWFGVFFLL